MNTITINVSEAKTHFSKYADLVQKGKTIILAKRNIPFAKILPMNNPVATVQKRKKLLGSLRGKVAITGDINQPLTKEELGEWYSSNL